MPGFAQNLRAAHPVFNGIGVTQDGKLVGRGSSAGSNHILGERGKEDGAPLAGPRPVM